MKNAMRLLSVVVIGSVLLTGSAGATAYYWTNTVPSNWEDGFSWNPLGIPGAADSARFYSNGVVHVTFTNDISSAFTVGNVGVLADVTFDLGGKTFTRVNGVVNFDVNYNSIFTMTNGTLNSWMTFSMAYGGDYASQTSRVVVGQGGVWNQTGTYFNVGYRYRGEFNVENGGQLNTDMYVANGILIGRSETGFNGTGTLTVNGAGSTWTNYANNFALNQIYVAYNPDSTGTISVINGGRVVHKGGNVNFGYGTNGVGTLNILNGGVFDATPMQATTTFYVGQGVQSKGYATISGTDAQLLVGSNGMRHVFSLSNVATSSGDMTVENGGALMFRGTNFFVGLSGMGVLTVQNGGLVDLTGMDTNSSKLYIGNAATATGIVNVAGAGSEFRDGANAITNYTYVGSSVGSHGTINISDGGKYIHRGANMYIGNSGTGEMNITNGGIFDTRGSYPAYYVSIAYGAGSVGNVLVSGTGSKMYMGSNTLYVAQNATATGTLTIENGGSLFTSNSLYVAAYGNGKLVVRDGGTIYIHGRPGFSVGSAFAAAGSAGGMFVTGATTRVTVGDFNVGSSAGTGLVVIADGAIMESFRQITISGKTTNLLFSASTPEGTILVTGTNSVLRHIDPAADQSGGTSTYLSIGAVAYSTTNWTTTGIQPNYDQLRGKGTLIVQDGGKVDITGRLLVFSNSLIRVDGGRMLANEIGLESNSVFRAVLRLGDANSATAMMTATNETRIFGATLDVQLGSDFVYHYEDSYRLIKYGTTLYSGANRFNGIDHLDVITAGGVDFEIDYGVYDPGYITLTAIPEPGSLGLIGAGIGLAALLRRRRG